jgi:hypothetical protein
MKNNLIDEFMQCVLSHCEEQESYYKQIAYSSDYKDETVERIVNLGVAYADVSKYIRLVANNFATKNNSGTDLPNGNVGSPTTSRATVDIGNEEQADLTLQADNNTSNT